DEPRPHRGRGDGHGGARLRRAHRQGTADGIRPRAEPPDRTADGRSRRLMAVDNVAEAAENRAPAINKGEVFTSFDVNAFEVPSGRDEVWRFTPLRRLRGLHDGTAPATGTATVEVTPVDGADRKSTRLNSSHVKNSYADSC